MSSPISDGMVLAAAAMLLSACSSADNGKTAGEPAECRVGAMKDFAPVCTWEWTGLDSVVIHHPDGGFRQLRFASGKAAEADGAANVLEKDGLISIDGDSYRYPLGLEQ